jgi:F-type H+-transporting ATPase subunit b
LRNFKPQSRFLIRIFSVAVFAAFSITLFCTLRSAAQQPAPEPQQVSEPAAADASNSTATEPAMSEEDKRVQSFLHSDNVKAVARTLHLSVEATDALFLLINFAIIFFAIVIPLVKFMPRVFRKRSQTLVHDLKTAREATEEARIRLSAVETKLTGLDKEITELRAQVDEESKKDEARIRTEMELERERIVAAAGQEIEAAATQARRNLRAYAAQLAIDNAAKQLRLTQEADRALVAEFVSQVAGEAEAGTGKGGSN